MFFVTLFVNNRYFQFKIDEFIQYLDKGYLSADCGVDNKALYFPIVIKGDSYVLGKKSSNFDIKVDNQSADENRVLEHGDYFVVTSDRLTYSVLITSFSNLPLTSAEYCLKQGNTFIGRSLESDIVIDINASVSRKCAAIRVDESDKYYIEDLSGKTGVYVNGSRESSKLLNDGDEIFIMGTTMMFYKGKVLIPSHIQTSLQTNQLLDMLTFVPQDSSDYYVRTPRIIKNEEQGKVVIDTPPAPQKSKDMPFILTVGPSMTMSLAMLASLGVTISNVVNGGSKGSLITSAVMAISMLAGALLWPALLRRYNKKQEEKNENYRRERYTAYLSSKEEEIKNKYERSIRILNENSYPSPELLLDIVSSQDRRLWEKTPKDKDFLTIRLGTGERDFLVDIQSPNKGFTLEDDPMLDGAIDIKTKYSILKNVPISLSLRERRVVGVVGSTIEALKIFVSNIIATHSFDEVKLVLVYNSSDIRKLSWLNDLPHVWSNDRTQRYIATNKNEVRTLFSNLEELISEREERLQKGETRNPHFVIFVLDEHLVEDIPFARHMLNAENDIGVSTVFFGRRFSNIPKECNTIIQRDDDVSGIYVKNENNNRFIQFKPDEISDSRIKKAVTDINKIKVKKESTHIGVPNRVTFLDMYRVGNVDSLEIINHWKTNTSEKSLAAPIGIKSDGEVFELDIHEKFHGCHGLVAGTTGSGKSEFLQAYILSMMINYSPNEVSFVLVDFKGGDMARPFLKSPHLAATISNLSGNTLHRALLSLEAEVKSRQNIFNRSAEALGVDKIDINSYQRYFKDKKLRQPLPHLIIVIDEFAQLKAQHPEFMAKLVDIAQVGRSLGIHLILATQRPSGVVDPQIWSNSKFKVCLKVLDKQDSMDMINHPEAALIKQPGRAYVQVGYDEIFEQIQSGYSGADYVELPDYIDEDSISLSMVNWTAEKVRTAKKVLTERKSNRTQLEEIVSMMVNLGESEEMRTKQLWLPPLPNNLLLEKCAKLDVSFLPGKWNQHPFGKVVCGLADLPEKQEQNTYGFDFVKDGHLAIYGSSGAGKSTLINTILFSMALKYSPEMFNVFVMDFDGSSLAGLTAMPHCSLYANDSDEKMIEQILSVLKTIIDERHELFAEHHCANYESYISNSDHQLPMILLVLDNYAAFREKMYRCEDTLVQLVSAARSCGIYFIVTGNSKGAIYYKITEQIPSKVVLNMNDSGAYRDILNVSIPIVPETAKGRGLVVCDKKAVEVQFAVPFDTNDEASRMRKIHLVYDEMRKVSNGVSYDEYVDDIELVDAKADYESTTIVSKPIIPIDEIDGNDDILLFGFDVKTKVPRGFLSNEGTKVFVGLNGDDGLSQTIISNIVQNSRRKIYVVSSNEDDIVENRIEIVADIDAFVDLFIETEEIYTLVIDGFCDFYDRISDEALMKLERALSNGKKINIVTTDSMRRINEYRDTGLYVHLVRAENGVIVGGGINDELAAALNGSLYELPLKHRDKQLSNDQAIIYQGSKMSYLKLREGDGNGR